MFHETLAYAIIIVLRAKSWRIPWVSLNDNFKWEKTLVQILLIFLENAYTLQSGKK